CLLATSLSPSFPALAASLAVCVLSLASLPTLAAEAGAVDEARMRAAENDGRNWMSWGRTYNEQRFSPLTQINEDTVSELGLAWYYDLDTFRGVEGTPIVVDGVMY